MLVAGVSFADLAWVRLGVDPMDGDARVVDGRDIDGAELAGRLLVAQCDNAFVLSDVKLALLEHLGPDTPVTVLQRLGLPDERIAVVALEELDRGAVEPDHLTSVFVDAGAVGAARELVRLLQLAKRLRDPGGCPWDAEQTHHSLTRYILEESYEVVEAVENLADGRVRAARGRARRPALPGRVPRGHRQEAGEFTMADVARGIHDKLVRRHPHVFGDVVAERDRRRDAQLGADQEGGEGHHVDRRRHHARAAVAPLHAQAVPQGGVGRPRSRRRSTTRSTASTPRVGVRCAPTTRRRGASSPRCWPRR